MFNRSVTLKLTLLDVNKHITINFHNSVASLNFLRATLGFLVKSIFFQSVTIRELKPLSIEAKSWTTCIASNGILKLF